MSNRFVIIWSAVLLLTGAPELDGGQLPNLLAIPQDVIEFSVVVGANAEREPSLYNGTTAPVTITAFSISGPQAADFAVTPNTCPISPATLGLGDSCAPMVTFAPSATGLRLANLVITDVGGASQTVVLVGEGLAQTKSFSLSVPALDFGDSPLGLSKTGQISLLATGTLPVTIQSVQLGGAVPGDFTITNNCTSIPANSSCILYLSFSPTTVGFRPATLTITTDAQPRVQSAPVTGIGTADTTILQTQPAAMTFASIPIGDGELSSVTVLNAGSESITINSVAMQGQNAADFAIPQNICQPLPYILPAGQHCGITVQFSPSATGLRLANIQITDTAPGSPHTVAVEGVGLPDTVSLAFSPVPAALGTSTAGVPSDGSTTLTNAGTVAAQVSFTVEGPNASDFGVASSCPSLHPSSSCNVPITFTPAADGIRVATLVATDSVSGQSRPLSLVGGGAPAGTALSGSSPVFPAALVGSQVSANASASIGNPGQTPVTITKVALTGASAADFGITNNGCKVGFVLTAQSACSMGLTFQPSATGTRISQLEIGYTGGNALFVPVAGQGLPPARTLSFDPQALQFAAQSVDVPSTNTVSIQNTGDEPIGITGLSVNGPAAGDYTIAQNQCPQAPATLAPAASCQVAVQLIPSAPGARIGRLQVSDDASGSPQILPMAGVGVNAAPAVQVSPESVNFNSEPLGSSTTQSISLAPVAGPPVILNGESIIGPAAADFTLANNCVSPLVQCDIYVTFTPSVTGVRSAAVEIQDNASGNPQIVPLSGFGILAQPPGTITINAGIPLVFSPAQGIGYTETSTIDIVTTGNVQFSNFQVGGRNAGDFAIQTNNCPPSTTTPVRCQVTIGFTPSATGVRLATFTVTDTAAGSPQSVARVGEGLPPTKILDASPQAIDFEPVSVGGAQSATLVVTNYGSLPVTFAGFTLGGPNASDFSIFFNRCKVDQTLYQGQMCYIIMDFAPTATGARTAVLTISSDSANSPQTVSLSGTGQ
jgi:hypothetical protein